MKTITVNFKSEKNFNTFVKEIDEELIEEDMAMFVEVETTADGNKIITIEEIPDEEDILIN